MTESKPLQLPLGSHTKLTNIGVEDKLQDTEVYRRLIGKLIYLISTRPDITYVVQLISQFMQAPIVVHLQATKNVVRYLKGSAGQGILLSSASPTQLIAYCDFDWGSCMDSRKST